MSNVNIILSVSALVAVIVIVAWYDWRCNR